MKLKGFIGRMLLVYGVPILAVFAADNVDIAGEIFAVVIGASVLWMFVFYLYTRDW